MATILGLHGGVTLRQHEPSVCLIRDGKILALFEEERYLRHKSAYGRLPLLALRDALTYTKIQMKEIDLVVTTGITYTDGFAERIHAWMRHHFGYVPKIEPVHHQLAHCAAAFYGSGFEEATTVSLDSSGDGLSGYICHATRKNSISVVKRVRPDNSLGAFYTLLTHYLGFEDGDEYKVMGLAAYGRRQPAVIEALAEILRLEPAGWSFDPHFLMDDPPPRSPFEPSYDQDRLGRLLRNFSKEDIAWATQDKFEAAYLNFLEGTKSYANSNNLTISGGCALNCSANRKVLYQGEWKNVYASPVASDRGLSLGCAYLGSVSLGDSPDSMKVPYLGRDYSNDEILSELVSNGINHRVVLDPAYAAVNLLQEEKIIGWFQGRSEAGARALGNRSILAPPMAPFKQTVNSRIKFREEFRPFAPSATTIQAAKHFVTKGKEYPTMSATVDFIPGPYDLGAVVHVDRTARLQTVVPEDNERFHSLLTMYGAPVLNTSFNLKGQPIVESPRDALATFYSCGLDALVIGDFVVEK